jgi:enediyne biosynthesis protein E3
MWFVGGTDAELVASMISKFPRARQADLYSGAGLAACYAGGADEEELAAFAQGAGECQPQVAQGCAFAATARAHAGLVVPHTRVATRVLCGMTVEKAAQVCENALPEHTLPGPGGMPAYEVWRRRIAAELWPTGSATA